MSARIVCHCGTEFDAKRSDREWCDACRLVRQLAKGRRFEASKETPCPDCGGPMGRHADYCIRCSNRRRGEKRRAENNGYWRGGRTRANGYVYIRVRQDEGGAGGPYKAEHHIVWEQANGKPLPKGWVVHHLNGVKDDNRPENLLGLPKHQHHSHPREALRPYEERIKQLESELRALRINQ